MKRVQLFSFCFCCFLFSFSTKSKVQAKVLINEVLPYPEDGVEAIEIVYVPDNPQDQSINLEGWSIWDELATSSCLYVFGEEILSSGDFLIKTFSNKLNNSADGVIIKNLEGEIQDKFSYSSSEKNLSYSRLSFNSNDFFLAVPSLGEENIAIVPSVMVIPTPTIIDQTTQESSSTPNPQQDHDTLEEIKLEDDQSINRDANINYDELYQNQAQLIEKISKLKNIIEKNTNAQSYYAKNTNEDEFITTLEYKTTFISSIGVVSVIIGGLFFLIASRLIYE